MIFYMLAPVIAAAGAMATLGLWAQVRRTPPEAALSGGVILMSSILYMIAATASALAVAVALGYLRRSAAANEAVAKHLLNGR